MELKVLYKKEMLTNTLSEKKKKVVKFQHHKSFYGNISIMAFSIIGNSLYFFSKQTYKLSFMMIK